MDVEHNDCVMQGGAPYPLTASCATTSCIAPDVVQPPVFGDPPIDGCLEAWGERSAYAGFEVVADDFTLDDDASVTDIHWWGCYEAWLDTEPPSSAPGGFVLGFWSHVPPFGGDPPTQFGRPGTLLHLVTVERAALSETYVGCSLDTLFEFAYGSCFHYQLSVDEPDRFSGSGGTTYWLSIAAVYGDVNCACDADVAAPFGTYTMADVDFVVAHLGCSVGMGDPDCDAADVNCDGVVDEADEDMADCQRIEAWANPSCCYVVPETAWGWTTRPFETGDEAVRIFSPTAPMVGWTFGIGASVVDGFGMPAELAFVMTTSSSSFVTPDPPESDGAGIDRNRYLGFRAPASWATESIAVRVKLVSLDLFASFNGEFRWAGAASTYSDTPSPSIQASALGCEPVFTTWPKDEPVYVYGAEIVPMSTYEVQAIDVSCQGDPDNEACYSSALVVQTLKWGDIVPPLGGASQPSFGDVTEIVKKFQGDASSVSKVRTQLQPNTPNPSINVNFQDISVDVAAFQGAAYPYTGPVACP